MIPPNFNVSLEPPILAVKSTYKMEPMNYKESMPPLKNYLLSENFHPPNKSGQDVMKRN